MPNPLSRRLRRRWLPQVVAVLLVVTQLPGAEPAAAQAPVQQPNTPAPATAAPPPPGPVQPVPVSQLPVEQNLTVRPLAGNGEMNDLQRHVMAPLVVQVVDQNERPMDGAQVVFRFPLNGPGATFAGGKTSATFRTNSGGQAAATNWMANGQVGTFEIHVSASYGNQEGETTVKMTNVTRIEEAKKAKGDPKNPPLASSALLEFMGPGHTSEELRFPGPVSPRSGEPRLQEDGGLGDIESLLDHAGESANKSLARELSQLNVPADRLERLKGLLQREAGMLQVMGRLQSDVAEITRRMKDETKGRGF